MKYCLQKFKLSSKSIAKLVSIKKPQDVQGLIDIGKEMEIPVEYVDRDELAKITAPNPSETVKAFEGTASVSEAAAIKVSGGRINCRKAEIPTKFDYSYCEDCKLKRGLLLIDRGSREREASEELETICAGIKAKEDYVFTDFCFLEVEPPYIEDGISKCLKEDIDSLTIVPYFLYPGKKVKIAVTDVMKFQKDTKVKFVVTKPMSMHKTLVDLVENRISTTLKENQVTLPKKDVDVMIIGHGSKDPNAQMSLDYIVNGLENSYRNVSRCWLEIEQPDIFEGIKKCEKMILKF